uniref:Ig-like domain-containing protein n=1 Tax=Meloidogyne hapla TaxID=6305 RepID=A0A1I8BNL6_MELHA
MNLSNFRQEIRRTSQFKKLNFPFKQIDSENMLVRIYPNGSVLYSSRLSLVCSCPMYLQLYPLDVQFCDFDLISYAHTTRDIIYEWAGNGSLHDSVQIKQGVGQDLPDFRLDYIDTGVECTSHTTTGSYACLRMRIRLSRLFTYFVLQLYIPTSMVVCVSLVSFWIDMHSTAGRVTLAITTLLTITTMQSSINAKLPPVNYIKVVDVWLGACELFVFSALVEYAIVCYRDSTLRNSKRRDSMIIRQKRKSLAGIEEDNDSELLPPPAEQQWDDWTNEEKSVIYDDGNLPCSCELGGIGNAVLVSLGMVPIGGLIPQSLLIPIAASTQGRTAELQNNRSFSLKILERHKQRNPFCSWLKRKLKKSDYQPARIDYYARIWMPICFITFSCIYWAVCLFMASKQY